MLKTSKLSHKSHKDSAMRKNHLSRKALPSRSPDRGSRNSRLPPIKRISPGMKRGPPIPKRKPSPASRLKSIASSPHRTLSHRGKPESPVSIDRARVKDLKYDKRKPLSRSPVRHLGPSSVRRPPVMQHEVHDVAPYPERYHSSAIHPPQYSPPRKKTRREADRYFRSRSRSASPPRRHMTNPHHSGSQVPIRIENAPPPAPVLHHKHRHNIPLGRDERDKHSYDIRNKHASPPIMSRGHSKDAPLKVPYPHESSRYQSVSPDSRYLPGAAKSYGPTLHERFSSVIESNRTEPRILYSREDLEKITIDIKGNIGRAPPLSRHLMNPSEVAHRVNEGHRPIFDREEIKQTSRDSRYDAYYDRKTSSYSSTDLKEVANYQITHHRFESHAPSSSNSGRTLNERWQNHEGKKGALSLDKDEREKEYGKLSFSRNYIGARSRSRSDDRDFRSERYLGAKTPTSRSDYPNRPPLPPAESRNNISYRKTALPVDARHKLNIRKGDGESHLSTVRPGVKDHYLPPDRNYIETIPPSSRVERREYHSPIPEPHKWYKSRSPSRDKFSDFPRRPDKYPYRSPEISSKATHYEEPEDRDGPGSFRGSSRPFRSPRGFRGRGFRGASRGSSFYRGSFRGSYRNSSSPRGRGISRR